MKVMSFGNWMRSVCHCWLENVDDCFGGECNAGICTKFIEEKENIKLIRGLSGHVVDSLFLVMFLKYLFLCYSSYLYEL